MGDRTGIAWTDATWNPLRGCSKVSAGCANCYAESVARRFGGEGLPYEGVVKDHGDRGWNGQVRFIEEHLADPLRWKRPRRIFVNSMSDLFHERVPDEWIDRIFAVMALAPQHTFQILTKRPSLMRSWSHGGGGVARADFVWKEMIRIQGVGGRHVSRPEWPLPNVWLGVSVEDANHRNRIDVLRQTPAAVRFVSFEPLIGELRDFSMKGVAWAIFGGESGPGARPCDVAWVRSGMATCRHYGTAVFVKQMGSNVRGVRAPYPAHPWPMNTVIEGETGRILLRDRKGGDPEEWPEDLRVRQFPAGSVA